MIKKKYGCGAASLSPSRSQIHPATWLCPLGLTLAATLLSPAAGAAPMPSETQARSSVDVPPSVFDLSTSFKPPGEGAPKDTSTAGSRDEDWCRGDRQPIRSLMPASNYGLTFAERPTVYLEMPQTVATQVLLVLEDEAGHRREKAIVPIPAPTAMGVVALPFPKTAAELVVGQNYRWSVAVMCQGYLDPSDPLFQGWVQRVLPSPKTTQNLSQLTPVEQVKWLGKRGHWYDMVSVFLQHQ